MFHEEFPSSGGTILSEDGRAKSDLDKEDRNLKQGDKESPALFAVPPDDLIAGVSPPHSISEELDSDSDDSTFTESGTWNVPDYSEMQGGVDPTPPSGFSFEPEAPFGPPEKTQNRQDEEEESSSQHEQFTESGTWSTATASGSESDAESEPLKNPEPASSPAEATPPQKNNLPSPKRLPPVSPKSSSAPELPKPKAFGTFSKSKKPTSSSSGPHHESSSPRAGNEFFTVIGDKETVSDPNRLPKVPDEPSPGRYDSSVIGSQRHDIVQPIPPKSPQNLKRQKPGRKPPPPPKPPQKSDVNRTPLSEEEMQTPRTSAISNAPLSEGGGWDFVESQSDDSPESSNLTPELRAQLEAQLQEEAEYDSSMQSNQVDFEHASGVGQETPSSLEGAWQDQSSHSAGDDIPYPENYEAQAYEEPDFQEPAPAAVEHEIENKTIRDALTTIATADSSIENNNHKVALPLYTKAIKVFREEQLTATSEFAHCLERYGDCHYLKGNYEEALNAYREYDALFSRTELIPEQVKVISLLKLGKTSHRMKRFADSEAAYELAINIANSTLPVKHPLIPIVYHSYTSMLKSRGADQFKIDKLESDYEKRSEACLALDEVPEDLKSELSPWIDPDPTELAAIVRHKQASMTKQKTLRESLESTGTLARVKSKININPTVVLGASLGGAFLILVVAFLFLGTNWLDVLTQGKVGADGSLKGLIGNVYLSADGMKKLEINNDQSITLDYGSNKATVPAYAGEPESGLPAELKRTFLGKTSCTFIEVEGGLKDPDGTILYDSNAKDRKVIDEMKNIMKLANFYYSRNGQYPRKRKNLQELGPEIRLTNPLGGSMKPRFDVFEFEKYEGDVAFSQRLQDYRSGKALFPMDEKPGIDPGLIQCTSVLPYDFYHKEEGISFIIRAYGSDGKFITSSLANEVFVLAEKNGVPFNPIKEDAIVPVVRDETKSTAYLLLKSK